MDGEGRKFVCPNQEQLHPSRIPKGNRITIQNESRGQYFQLARGVPGGASM
jgi:hypothetical protein